ncbi:hypothetical protein ACFZDG_18420 [Kitasatospora xanthocidica]|uniref:hypothetical protein n=1 Tax=Kitasatospora xanthocidica TaxID=83382 RepID=UPI0036ED96B2
MAEQPQYYRAEVHVRTVAGDLATYYGDAGRTPSEALKSAAAFALAEHPGRTVAGHRVWPTSD